MALYNLAVMHHNGLGTARACELAVQYLKNVVERGSWVSVLQNASRSFDDEDYESALQMYTLAAEQVRRTVYLAIHGTHHCSIWAALG